MHPVLEIIQTRAQEGSQPGKRSDPYKLALAIEGGGMRGVVSAGMVTGLESLGLLATFDAVYGNSGGAINGAYFVAGQANYGTTIYYENINSRDFLSLARMFGKRPVMSLEFLLDDVAARQKVLDCEGVLRSPVPLNVIVSSVRSCRSEVLAGFANSAELIEALRASAKIPLVAGPPVSIGDDLYLDGMIFESIPLQSPIAAGFTHILALLTRPIGCPVQKPSFLVNRMTRKHLGRLNPSLAEAFDARSEEYTHSVQRVMSGTANPSGPPYVCALALPQETKAISGSEKDRSILVRGAIDGMSVVFEAFGQSDVQIVEVLAPFTKATGQALRSDDLQR